MTRHTGVPSDAPSQELRMSEHHRETQQHDPLAAMRSHWVVVLVLAVIGALGGMAVATQHAKQTTAEARLAVGSQDLQAYQVAGFAAASHELAADYARFVADSPTTQTVVSRSLDGARGRVLSLSASPIPDSSVVRIEATATTATAAERAAGAIADNLVRRTASHADQDLKALVARHKAVSLRVANQQARVEEAEAAEAPTRILAAAQAKLATLRMEQTAVSVDYQKTVSSAAPQSSLRLIQPATVSGDDRKRTLELYTLAGLAVGLALGLVVATVLARRRPFRR
jgi:predicted GIY-YIG superfamily endonuclease